MLCTHGVYAGVCVHLHVLCLCMNSGLEDLYVILNQYKISQNMICHRELGNSDGFPVPCCTYVTSCCTHVVSCSILYIPSHVVFNLVF